MTSMTLTKGVVDTVAKVTDYDSIQAAIDAAVGPVYFPPGQYQIDEPLVINKPGVTLFGFGNAKAVPGPVELVCRANPAIRITDAWQGCQISGLFFSGWKDSDVIHLEGGEVYRAGLMIENVGIRGGKRAVVARKTGKNLWVGNVTVRDCSISRCDQGIVCDGVGFTNFDAVRSSVRQCRATSGPVIDVSGNRLAIDSCCAEGQQWPIRIRNSCAAVVKRCYFEGHKGCVLVDAFRVNGLRITDNFLRVYDGEVFTEFWRTVECRNTHLDHPIINTGKWEVP